MFQSTFISELSSPKRKYYEFVRIFIYFVFKHSPTPSLLNTNKHSFNTDSNNNVSTEFPMILLTTYDASQSLGFHIEHTSIKLYYRHKMIAY